MRLATQKEVFVFSCCEDDIIHERVDNIMKLAVTYRNIILYDYCEKKRLRILFKQTMN